MAEASEPPEAQKEAFIQVLAVFKSEIDEFLAKHKNVLHHPKIKQNVYELKATYIKLAREFELPEEPWIAGITGLDSAAFQIVATCKEHGGRIPITQLRELLRVRMGLKTLKKKSIRAVVKELKAKKKKKKKKNSSRLSL